MIVKGNSLQGEKYTRCHDYNLSLIEDTYIIACVADGVGDNEYCQIGSRLVCEELCRYFKSELEEIRGIKTLQDKREVYLLMQSAFLSAHKKVEERATQEGHDVQKYDTTLSAICITSDYVVWGHSGDGAIFSISETGVVEKLTTEQSGDMIGEVYTLFSGNMLWSFGITQKAYAFLLMTDGVLDYFNKFHYLTEDISEFYNKLFYEIINEKEDTYISNLVFSQEFKKVTSDDRTLLIVADETLSIPSDFYYVEEQIRVRPNQYAKIMLEQKEALIDTAVDVEKQMSVSKQESEECKNNPAEIGDVSADIINESDKKDEKDKDENLLETKLKKEELNLFTIQIEDWLKYVHPDAKMAVVDEKEEYTNSSLSKGVQVVFVSALELAAIENFRDIEKGVGEAAALVKRLFEEELYLFKQTMNRELSCTVNSEFYEKTSMVEYDYYNGITLRVCATRDYIFLEMSFNRDFFNGNMVLLETSLYSYYYNLMSVLRNSVLRRHAVINSDLPKYRKTNLQELIKERKTQFAKEAYWLKFGK